MSRGHSFCRDGDADRIGTHGRALNAKIEKNADLSWVGEKYETLLAFTRDNEVNDKASVIALVEAFNRYRSAVVDILDERDNSGQEGLRSTILEEFFFHLFRDVAMKRLEGDIMAFPRNSGC